MSRLMRLYDGLIVVLAASAALVFVLMVVGIVVNVALRNLDMSPVQATSALIEYGLLFATMTGAPWLIRDRGHVAIRVLVANLPEGLAKVIDRLMLVACVAILAVLCWRAGVVTAESVAAGARDIRSVTLPGWILPGMLCAGFGLMGTEFLRLLLRGERYDASGAAA